MRIIHFSDSHISGDKPARESDLERCVQLINATEADADAVIHTGDIAHDAHTEEYATAHRLLSALEPPCFVLAGNRDNRARLINQFADDQNIRHDDEFIQYSIEHFPVRLIVLDTVSADGNTGGMSESGSNKGRLCDKRLAHLENMLAADSSRPVAIFMHHSPFEATAIPDPFQFENWQEVERFHALLAGYDQIRGIYCGHIHRNAGAIVGGIPITAITCMACDLRKGDMSDAERSKPAFNVLNLN